jgi:hypothetical protein
MFEGMAVMVDVFFDLFAVRLLKEAVYRNKPHTIDDQKGSFESSLERIIK